MNGSSMDRKGSRSHAQIYSRGGQRGVLLGGSGRDHGPDPVVVDVLAGARAPALLGAHAGARRATARRGTDRAGSGVAHPRRPEGLTEWTSLQNRSYAHRAPADRASRKGPGAQLLPTPRPSGSASRTPTVRLTRGPEGSIRQTRRWTRRARQDDSTRFLRRIRRSRSYPY